MNKNSTQNPSTFGLEQANARAGNKANLLKKTMNFLFISDYEDRVIKSLESR